MTELSGLPAVKKLNAEQREELINATLAWLDACAVDEDTEEGINFDMMLSWSGPASKIENPCGTHACIGGYMCLYAVKRGWIEDASRTHIIAENAGILLGMNPSDINDLFYNWPCKHEANAATAAFRLRHYLKTGKVLCTEEEIADVS